MANLPEEARKHGIRYLMITTDNRSDDVFSCADRREAAKRLRQRANDLDPLPTGYSAVSPFAYNELELACRVAFRAVLEEQRNPESAKGKEKAFDDLRKETIDKGFTTAHTMPEELGALIERAREYKMGVAECEEQIRSVAYGNAHMHNRAIPQEVIDRAADELKAAQEEKQKAVEAEKRAALVDAISSTAAESIQREENDRVMADDRALYADANSFPTPNEYPGPRSEPRFSIRQIYEALIYGKSPRDEKPSKTEENDRTAKTDQAQATGRLKMPVIPGLVCDSSGKGGYK